jgi:hypothetical protein
MTPGSDGRVSLLRIDARIAAIPMLGILVDNGTGRVGGDDQRDGKDCSLEVPSFKPVHLAPS